MKRSLLLTCCLGVAHSASAQSSVTLFGSLDQGVSYISNIRSESVTRVDSGTLAPDRFGLRGSEALGGGVKANFLLESGFSTDTGTGTTAGQLFNRQSWVGLSSERWGEFRMGHQPDLVQEIVGRVSNGLSLLNVHAFHPGNFDNLSNQFRADNAIKYFTPTMGGLRIGGMWGFGETPGAPSRGRTYSLGASYASGSLLATLGYTSSRDRAIDIAGRTGVTSILGATLAPGNVAMDKIDTLGGGASYQFTAVPIKANALFTLVRIADNGYSATQRNADIGVSYKLNGATRLNAGYNFSELEGARWHQVTLGAVYSLSKRTEIYAQALTQRAAGDAQFAAMHVVGVSGSRNQTLVGVGMHHAF